MRLAHFLSRCADVCLDLLGRHVLGGMRFWIRCTSASNRSPTVSPVLETLREKLVHSPTNENGQALLLLDRQVLEGAKLVVVQINVGASHLSVSGSPR